jgi:hypothetical protein
LPALDKNVKGGNGALDPIITVVMEVMLKKMSTWNEELGRPLKKMFSWKEENGRSLKLYRTLFYTYNHIVEIKNTIFLNLEKKT